MPFSKSLVCLFFLWMTSSKHQCFKECYQARLEHDSIPPAPRARVRSPCNTTEAGLWDTLGEQHIFVCVRACGANMSGTWLVLMNACCGISLGFVNTVIVIEPRKVIFEPNSLDHSPAMEGYYNHKSSSWTQSKY